MSEVKSVDSIANRIKKAMEIREMKAVDICNRTGISKGSMSQYLKGTFEPKSDRIYIIAQALSVDPVWLCGFDVPMEKSDAQKEAEKDAELLRAFHNAPYHVQNGVMAILAAYL